MKADKSCKEKGDYWLFVPLGVWLVSVIIFGEQVFLWLKEGEWGPRPVKDYLECSFTISIEQWLTDESSWIGLKSILSSIFYGIYNMSFPALLFILGIILFFVLGGIFISLEDYKKRKADGEIEKQDKD